MSTKYGFSRETQECHCAASLQFNGRSNSDINGNCETIVCNAFDGTVLSRIHEDVSLALFLADSYDVLLARRYAECATETSDALEQNKWSAVLGRHGEIHPSSGIIGWTNKCGQFRFQS
jgi:hypothetical protein